MCRNGATPKRKQTTMTNTINTPAQAEALVTEETGCPAEVTETFKGRYYVESDGCEFIVHPDGTVTDGDND